MGISFGGIILWGIILSLVGGFIALGVCGIALFPVSEAKATACSIAVPGSFIFQIMTKGKFPLSSSDTQLFSIIALSSNVLIMGIIGSALFSRK